MATRATPARSESGESLLCGNEEMLRRPSAVIAVRAVVASLFRLQGCQELSVVIQRTSPSVRRGPIDAGQLQQLWVTDGWSFVHQ